MQDSVNSHDPGDSSRASETTSVFGDHFLPGERNIPAHQRIYTNRNLRMEGVHAIGFDMDHTLALYDRRSFEQLTFDMAVENLVEWKGYPEAIRALSYDPDFIVRGLLVDKELGNLLKMDSHNYIAIATHGTRMLSKEERLEVYRNHQVDLADVRYQSFDTFFSMPEGSLYAAIVSLKEDDPEGVMQGITISQIYDDVRGCVDKVHRDGSLKAVIVKDLRRYFVADENLRPTLERFRAMGKKLFLLTNSEYEYTDAVLSHLLTTKGESWHELFDLIICESKKPKFFMEGRSADAIDTGSNDRDDYCFRGANAAFIEGFLGHNGDEILYFGDHTYGDILRSKKTVGWRTAMVIFELEREIRINERRVHLNREISDLLSRARDLRRDRDQLNLLLRAMRRRVSDPAPPVPSWAQGFASRELKAFVALSPADRERRTQGLAQTLAGLDFLVRQTVARREVLDRRLRDAHNHTWGRVFREGSEISRFGRQVKEFACIYTSRVANFLHYPGDFYFTGLEERMPHER
jgi:HAD superfamily 5'-nucleotidase-like hydrolase